MITWFVDSVDGNDSNTGQLEVSTIHPLKTIAALISKGINTGDAISLKLNSLWREKLNLGKNGVSVNNYAVGGVVGELPILTVFNIVSPSAWNLEPGLLFTYKTTIAHSITEAGTAYAYVLEDGNILVRKNSIALVESTPGSFYCPNDAAISTHNPYTLYYHPSSSDNPLNNGKVVEANARDHAIEDVENNNNTFEGLQLRGCGVDDGCIDAGLNVTLRRILFTYGGKHHVVFRSGLIEDSICALYDPTWPNSPSPFTAYAQEDTSSYVATIRRCFGVDASSFLSHSGVGMYAGNHVEECILNRGVSFGALDNKVISSMISTPNGSAVSSNLPNATLSVEHSLIKQFTGSGVNVGIVTGNPKVNINISQTGFFVNISSIGSRFFVNAGINSPVVCSNATLVNQGLGSTGYVFLAKSSLVLNNCLIVLTSIYQFIDCLSFLGDNNVYVMIGNNNWFFRMNGVQYVNNFGAWKTATGQDQNSLFFNGSGIAMGDVFSGDISSGDFRINPNTVVGQAIMARNAGVSEHWDWNLRSVVSGPSVKWPISPGTMELAKSYVNNPGGWNFYL